jgi:mannitol-1-phosphate/altronate dehydrogenase
MSKLANALEGGPGKEGWGGVPYVRIDGETDSRDRRTACLQFKEDPAIRVALLSITAAGTCYCCSQEVSTVLLRTMPDCVADSDPQVVC